MNPERDNRIYQLAKGFMEKEFEKHGRNAQVFNTYLKPANKPDNLKAIYIRLLESGKNAQRMPKVIASGIGKIENLGEALFDFDFRKVLDHYANDDKRLCSEIMGKFRISTTSQLTWGKYSKTILSGAKFMAQFRDYNDFDLLIRSFPKDERAQYSAALFLREEIFGFGIALSCDFLKEIGYTEFGKPDVIVKRIFQYVGLAESNTDYEVLKVIGRVAKNSGVTPFNVDKVFWLIGSSLLHNEIDPKTGKPPILPGKKNREKRFVELTKII